MTEAEHSQLKHALLQVPHPKKRYLKAALNIAVFWIFLLAGGCLGWFILSLVVAALTNIDIGPSSFYASFIFTTLIMIAALFAINSTRRWLGASPNEYALIKADLNAVSTTEVTFQVKGVKCFKEPQFGGRLYFLLLQAQSETPPNIRVVYDYASQQTKHDSQLLCIKQTLTLSIGALSGYVHENKFSGDRWLDIEEATLTVSPEYWPEADSWLSHDWESLTAIYGLKQ